MDEVNKRNAETIRQKLQEMDEKMYVLEHTIKSQSEAITTLLIRLNSVEQQLIIFKVRSTGTGPSV